MKFTKKELEEELRELKKRNWLNKDFNENEFIEKIINLEFTSPNREDVFNAFKLFEPKETKILIIGQDPYPNPEKAQGLAFSCKKGKAASLTKIFKAVNIYKKNSTKNFDYDLTGWASKNKICLLNSALTFEKSSLYKGKQKKDLSKEQKKELEKDQQRLQEKHIEAWNSFITYVIKKLIKENKNLVVFLWGNKARKIFSECNGDKIFKHKFETCHPQKRSKGENSNTFLDDAPNHFKVCDEFLGEDIWKNFPENNQ